MLLVGIDPGLDGGVAVLGLAGTCGRGDDTVTAFKMPTRPHFSGKGREIDVHGLVGKILACRDEEDDSTMEPVGLIVVEEVGNRPRFKKGADGVKQPVKMGASSMFAFGDGFGKLRGVLEYVFKRVEYAKPQIWQKSIFAGRSAKGDPKKLAASFVSRRYPEVSVMGPKAEKPHGGLVDALCILEYARRLSGRPIE